MICFDEARAAILAAVRPLAAETIELRDALGRIPSEPIVADAVGVPFPRSAMDGYAVRSVECVRANRKSPVELPIAGTVFAEKKESMLAPGTALAITTGAPMPAGADAVVPHENTERHGDTLCIFAPVAPHDCVFSPGEDFLCGDELLAPGEPMHSGTLALLAFAGKTQLRAIQRPRVTILCTGDEIVEPDVRPAHGQVRNSNAVALAAAVAEMGGIPRYDGIAPDKPDVLAALLNDSRRDTDMLITTGGASRGERDFVKRALAGLGATFSFEQVAMRPGKPFSFAQWRGLPVCVLPGNPAAAYVCFQELVRPALALLAGWQNTALPRVRARLRGVLHSRSNRCYFVLARLEVTPKEFVVTPLANQCSALVRTAADANSLIIIPGVATDSEPLLRLETGEIVDVDVLKWPHACAVAHDTKNRAAYALENC